MQIPDVASKDASSQTAKAKPAGLTPFMRARAVAVESAGLIPFLGYCRMSNRRGDESAGIGRQKEDQEALAASLGGFIKEWYIDDGFPASDPDIARPRFEQLLMDLAEGAAAGLVGGALFYHADRFARLETDAARINLVFARHVRLIGRSATGGTDLTTVEGRAMFTMQATMGTIEVANIKRRVSRNNLANAKAGDLPVGRVSFGWLDDNKTAHPVYKPLLNQNLLDITKGKTIGEIRHEWLDLGLEVKRSTKRPGTHNLSHATVEYRLTNPRLCRYRIYLPQAERKELKQKLWLPDHIVYDGENPVLGDWDEIVEPSLWLAATSVIKKRKEAHAKGLTKPHTTAVVRLLAGIGRCGKCYFPLRGTPYSKSMSSYERWGFRYQCLGTFGGCGGVSRVGPLVDELVTSLFFEAQRRSLGSVERAPIDDTVHSTRLSEIAAEIEDVTARRRAKKISTSVALDAIEDLEAERAELLMETAELTASKLTDQSRLDSVDLETEWESFSINMKRQFLKRDIRAVLVHPTGRGKPFDPSTIEIVWAS